MFPPTRLLFLSLFLGKLALFSVSAAEPLKVHGYSIYGHPKYDKNFTHFEYVNPNAPKGGILKLSALGTFNSLNPFIIKGDSAAGLPNIYASLLTRSADEPNSYYGYAAETIEIDPDQLWVTFHLRREAQFQDGTPLRADDVIASYQTIIAKGLPFFKKYYQGVKDVKKIDEMTVKFTFSSASSRELMLILGEFPLFSKAFLESHDFEKSDLVIPVGSGPYKISSFKAPHYIIYDRVKGWWGENLPVNKGRHNFDQIRYDYFQDTSVCFEAFKSHSTDLYLESSAKNWSLGYEFAAAKHGKVFKEEFTDQSPDFFQALIYNLRNPLFADPKVREALGMVLDFEWLNKNIFYNMYTRTKSYFGSSDLASSGIPEGKEFDLLAIHKDQLPPALFTQEFKMPTTLPPSSVRSNLEKAQQLLKEAGWSIQSGRLQQDKTQREFKFDILIAQPSIEKVLQPYIQQLKRIGIEAHLKMIDASQYQQRVDNHDFDMIWTIIPQSSSPGNEQREFWQSSQADQVASMNVGGIKNPVIDQLVETLIQSPDYENLKVATHALDRVLLWNHYTTPLWSRKGQWIAYWEGLAHPKIHPAYGLDLMAWWTTSIDQKKQ